MTSTLDWIVSLAVWLEALQPSSSCLKMVSAKVGTVGVVPLPWQEGQVFSTDSLTEFIRRCRDISNRPNWEMVPIWMRARSEAVAFSMAFSMALRCSSVDISIKSITTKPPISRSCSWMAISLAASKLVLKAVSSISEPLVARAELISIAVSASVWSKTMVAPVRSDTSRLNTLRTWFSTPIWLKSECSETSKNLIRSR